MFTATNTSDGLDPSVRHYWRWHTYDYYTGVSGGVNSTLVGNTQVLPEFSVEQELRTSPSGITGTSIMGDYLRRSGIHRAWPGTNTTVQCSQLHDLGRFTAGLNFLTTLET